MTFDALTHDIKDDRDEDDRRGPSTSSVVRDEGNGVSTRVESIGEEKRREEKRREER